MGKVTKQPSQLTQFDFIVVRSLKFNKKSGIHHILTKFATNVVKDMLN